MKKLLAITGALSLMLCSAFANAGHISCSPDEASAVTGALGCDVGHTNTDTLNPLQVNIDEMFGYDDWIFGIKRESDDRGYETGAMEIGSDYIYGRFRRFSLEGEWLEGALLFNNTLENLFPGIDNMMLVIKGGNGGTTNSNYIGYDLDLTKDIVQFDTPFFDPTENGPGNPKGMSHWSLYGRGGDTFTTSCIGEDCDPTSVPEPASLALFGLAGIGLFLRRRKVA